MSKNNRIILNQILHGYSNGHKLISGSTEINSNERRIMQSLSDYSGSGEEKGFASYITGYPLPISKAYVLAKTWYADEMKRPGCVWTHSILINFTDLLLINNTEELVDLFKRPNEDSYKQYTSKIEYSISTNSRPQNLKKDFFKVFSVLYQNPNSNIILFANSSEKYQREILQIWDWQWPKLKRNFSFCTGSLSIRQVDDFQFDIQIIPYSRERNIINKINDRFKAFDLDEYAEADKLANLYANFDWDTIYEFMARYGSDVNGKRVNFMPLFEAYTILSNQDITQNWLERFFHENFTNPEDAKLLKVIAVESQINNAKESKIGIIKFLISNKSFENISWNLDSIIISLWNLNQLEPYEIVEIIRELYEADLKEVIISIVNQIPIKIWVEQPFRASFYLFILSSIEKIESEHIIWTLDENVQRMWFSALKKRKETKWEQVVFAMLKSNSDSYAKEIYEFVGGDITLALTEWVIEKDTMLPYRWKLIVSDNQDVYFNTLFSHKKFNKSSLQLALDVFDVNNNKLDRLYDFQIEAFVHNTAKSKNEIEVIGILTNFLLSCYLGKLNNSAILNSIIFQSLHNRLGEGIFHNDTWDTFKWNFGKDISQLQTSKFFTLDWLFEKNVIPEWDRCEFLRRAFYVSIFKQKWNPSIILLTITDEKTFDYFIDFVKKARYGKEVIEYLINHLAEFNKNLSFHFPILMKAQKDIS